MYKADTSGKAISEQTKILKSNGSISQKALKPLALNKLSPAINIHVAIRLKQRLFSDFMTSNNFLLALLSL